jgi:molybdopterin/thiamine biosynthesis adenylyltransferase/rhodanese-related sulfurtransferase
MLTKEEKSRYQKHIFLPEIGLNGQEKLKQAKVLVVGAGGLGSPVLQYLSAAGIGTIGIVDGDKVELSNLQRQVIYSVGNIGSAKAIAAAENLNKSNETVDYQVYNEFLKRENAEEIIDQYDIVVDCTDNFTVRYLINDICVGQNKPFVYGAIHKFEGQVSVFNFLQKDGNLGPTYRCLFPNQPAESEIPNCATVGVLGILPGTIGLYQANEVIKMILGIGEVLSGQLLLIDLLNNTQQKIKIKRKENIDLRIEIKEKRQDKKENKDDSTQGLKDSSLMQEISVNELNKKLLAGEDIQLIDVRLDYEYGICHLESAQLIPMNDIENKANQISKTKPVVFYCHHGMRSAHAIKTLQKMDSFDNLFNLVGGIDAWASEIDLEMDRY